MVVDWLAAVSGSRPLDNGRDCIGGVGRGVVTPEPALSRPCKERSESTEATSACLLPDETQRFEVLTKVNPCSQVLAGVERAFFRFQFLRGRQRLVLSRFRNLRLRAFSPLTIRDALGQLVKSAHFFKVPVNSQLHEAMRDMLEIILKDHAGCRVILAETSEQALGEAERNEVDAVISDLNRSPGMDGFQFLEAFQLAHPSTPVIIFSGTVTGARQRRALRLGAFRCMSKPATVDEILKLVREALEYRMARKGQAGVAPS